MFSQEYITTELRKTLEKMIILSSKNLKNLIFIILGIILSESVKLSDISKKLDDSFTDANEDSKRKRIYRFLSNEKIKTTLIYHFFIRKIINSYIKRKDNDEVTIIFDHTTIYDKFLILQFSLKVGRRAIPIWHKCFDYIENDNKNFKHVKEGLKEVHSILKKYNYDVIVLADRGFKSVDLFHFIDKKLKWRYCIRCTNDVSININENNKIHKLRDINGTKKTKHFNDVLLTKKKYKCNLAVCKADKNSDTWYLICNFDSRLAVKEYKKRFQIEEMFRDLKSNGFDLERTWTKNLVYCKNLYMCICIAYVFVIIQGAWCSKNKKSKIIGSTRKKGKKNIRVYSLFKSGLIWFNRCYNSCTKKYKLNFKLTLYDI